MNDNKPSVKPVTIDGVTMPANYSFGAINEFVHGDVCFEELQWAALGMANEIERLQAANSKLVAVKAIVNDDEHFNSALAIGKIREIVNG